MKWIARIFVFSAALFLGVFSASYLWAGTWLDVKVVNSKPKLSAKSLLGTWKGAWGYNEGECEIEIYRAEGTNFYGTLRKEGAEIRIQGTFDPRTRKLYFDETEVLRLGANMTGWSLGENRGVMSHDGRIMVGDGRDEWGQYSWAVSNY